MTTAWTEAAVHHRQWYIIGRWQEFGGEARANLLRVVGIGAFYAVELMNYKGLNLGVLQMPKQASVTPEFHQAVTCLAAAWTLLALGIWLCLRRRVFPAALKFISTTCDVVLLTSVAMVAAGAASPIVAAYFVIIALSALRFSLPLVWCATLASIGGYLWLLGHDRWFRDPPVTPLPRYHQLIFLISLALTGVVMGQVIRRVRRMAEDYLARLQGGKP